MVNSDQFLSPSSFDTDKRKLHASAMGLASGRAQSGVGSCRSSDHRIHACGQTPHKAGWWRSITPTMPRELKAAMSGLPLNLVLGLMTGALWLITTREPLRSLASQFSNFDANFLCRATASAGLKGVWSGLHISRKSFSAGVIPANWKGRFGFHNFRHSLATALVKLKVDPKTVQGVLRHEDFGTTMELYAQSDMESMRDAQGKFLEQLMGDKIHLLTERVQ